MNIKEAIENKKLLKDNYGDLGYIIGQDKINGQYLFVYKINIFFGCWFYEERIEKYFSLSEKIVYFNFKEALDWTKNESTLKCSNIKFIEEKKPKEDHKGMVQNYNGNWTWL